MKIKKILAFIVLLGFILVNTIPFAQALENPNYKFLEGGMPNFYKEDDSDDVYTMVSTFGEKTVSLSGSIYPTYHNFILNYLNMSYPLKKEPSYYGLSAWNGFIFIEPKKLKPGVNKIMWRDYYGQVDQRLVTNQDKSLFGINIFCGEGGDCTMSPYAGLDYSFPENYSGVGSSAYKNTQLNWSRMGLVQDFAINRETTPDFVILVNLELSQFKNDDAGVYQTRAKLEIVPETTPGSGKFRKPTETTKIVANFPAIMIPTTSLGYGDPSLKFIDHRNVYSLELNQLKADLQKIENAFGETSAHNTFESYYNYMKYQPFSYLLGLKFGQAPVTPKEIEEHTGNTGIDWDKVGKEDEPTLKECETLEIGCHIQNLGTTIKVGFLGLFSGLLKGIKSVFSWIWENVKGFAEPIVKPIYDFIINLIEEGKIIFEKIKVFFNELYEIIKNLFKGGTDPTVAHNKLTPGMGFRASPVQKLLCDNQFALYNKDKIQEGEGAIDFVISTLKTAFSLFSLVDPTAPTNGTEICTYEGVKTLHLRKNSFIDIIIFMFVSSMTLILFYKNS